MEQDLTSAYKLLEKLDAEALEVEEGAVDLDCPGDIVTLAGPQPHGSVEKITKRDSSPTPKNAPPKVRQHDTSALTQTITLSCTKGVAPPLKNALAECEILSPRPRPSLIPRNARV